MAKYGNYANYFGSADTFRHKTEVLQGHCRDVGRDFDEITLTRNLDCLVAADEAQLEEKAVEWGKRLPGKRSVEQWKEHALYGTPDQVAEQVRDIEALGIGYVMVYFADATWGDGMRLFGEQVIPALK